MIISSGKYLIRDFSTRLVKVKSSTTAWALACFKIEGLTKSVTLCLLLISARAKLFLLVVILHIVPLLVVVVKRPLSLEWYNYPVDQFPSCPKCQSRLEAADFFCRTCGYKLREELLSPSWSKQLSIYLLSFFLPPFGLVPAVKYLRQGDQKSKRVGAVAVILTAVSLLLTIRLATGLVGKFNAALSGQTGSSGNLGY
jgi:hypothetical protein